MKTTGETTSSTTPAPWLTDAAVSNLNFAQGVQSNGFTPYTGNQVAGFSPQQSSSFDAATNVANSVNGGPIGTAVSNYTNAGPQTVQGDTIANNMSPYMSAYVAQSLTPQIQAQDLQFANQNKAVDASATSAGAFGDTGWGQLRGTTTQAQNAARSGLIGNAYNTAFNTAIGAGAQDVANKINVGTTNANLAETALGRQLTGANAAYTMGTGAANLINQFGGQQTAQQQAQLNAAYNQWQMAQQFPFQSTQLVDQAITAGKAGAPTSSSSTTSAPDNSGFGMLGSIGGTVLGGPVGGAIGGALGGAVGGQSLGMGQTPLTPMQQYGSGAPQNSMQYGNGNSYPAFADGGTPPVGQPSIVGERGPEVFIPRESGVVIPHEILKAMAKMKKRSAAPIGLASQLGAAA